MNITRENSIDNVAVNLSIRIGNCTLTVGEIKNLKTDSIIELESAKNDGFTLESNGQIIARGMVTDVDGNLKFTVSSIGE